MPIDETNSQKPSSGAGSASPPHDTPENEDKQSDLNVPGGKGLVQGDGDLNDSTGTGETHPSFEK